MRDTTDPAEMPDAEFSTITRATAAGASRWQTWDLDWLKALTPRGQSAKQERASRLRMAQMQTWARIGDGFSATGAQLLANMHHFMRTHEGPWRD